MIYIYAEREACDDRLMGTLDQLQKFGTNQAVAFVNLLDQYGYWPEGYEAVIFCPDTTNDKHIGVVYHFTDTLEVLGTFDTRSSFLVDKMPEVFDNTELETLKRNVNNPAQSDKAKSLMRSRISDLLRPASDPQEWWG